MVAANASQHGNDALLNQNTTQANTIAMRADRHRRRGSLVSDNPVILRVDENVFVKMYLCHGSLTAIRTPTFTRKGQPVLYVAARSLISSWDKTMRNAIWRTFSGIYGRKGAPVLVFRDYESGDHQAHADVVV